MSKEIKLANKAIFNFICTYFLDDKFAFFDASNRLNQEKLKQLLINRFVFCRQSGMPDQQRRNIDQFFHDVDQYLLIEKPGTQPIMAAHEIFIKACWSLVGLLLLDDLKKNPTIHQGGYLRGRSSGGNHDSLLFLAILHRQLFGPNLTKAAKSYPLTWDSWTHFMRGCFESLTQDLKKPALSLQRQLWIAMLSSILDTINVDDTKRYEKFIYQLFFNIVNPFKSVTLVGSDYKIFEVPLTLIKANPTTTKGMLEVPLMETLQQLVKAPLTELRSSLSLPPATVVLITELKSKLKVTTAMSTEAKKSVPTEDESRSKTCLKVTRAVETYGSINADVDRRASQISHCHSSLYTHVPKTMRLESSAANDDCCACAIL